MKIDSFPRHLFWSYSPDADLPDDTVAEQVILYGDLDDLFRLSDMLPSDTISRVNRKIDARGRWHRRCYFIDKVLLGL